MIEQDRVYIEHNYQRSLFERMRNWAINTIFPYPGRMRALLAPLRIAERFGLRPLLRKLSPAALRDWLDLLPTLDEQAANGGTEGAVWPSASVTPAPAESATPTAVVHHGCVAQVLTDSENWNTEHALTAAGYRVAKLERTVCCGALDLHNGNVERAREFARTNLREFKKCGADKVVSAASGCAAVFAAYGDLLKDDPEFAADGRDLVTRVADISTLMVAQQSKFTRNFPVRVTYTIRVISRMDSVYGNRRAN